MFQPNSDRWIVTDIKSKIFLQEKILKQESKYSGNPVLRASELWKELFEIHGEWRILGASATSILLSRFLKQESKYPWQSTPGALRQVLLACRSLSSLICHPSRQDFLESFQSEFPDHNGIFFQYWKTAVDFLETCLSEKKVPQVNLASWLALMDQLPSGSRYFFDLGFEINDGERELIGALSRRNDVYVLIPGTKSDVLTNPQLYMYKQLTLGQVEVEEMSFESAPVQKPKLWRCSSPESEGRMAVEHISHLLSQGVKSSDILIAAPDISIYDDSLMQDIKWEGLSLERGRNARFSSTKVGRSLAARLKVASGQVNVTVLEDAFFILGSKRNSSARRKMKTQLELVESVEQSGELRKNILELQRVTRDFPARLDKFESVIISFFEGLHQDEELSQTSILNLLKKMRSEFSEETLDFNEWVNAWIMLTEKNDIKLERVPEGIGAVELSSVDDCPQRHVIVLGLVDRSAFPGLGNLLRPAERKFLNEIGFSLEDVSHRAIDSQLKWLLTSSRHDFVYSCAASDTFGGATAPNEVWLELAMAEKKNLDLLDVSSKTQKYRSQFHIASPEVQGFVGHQLGLQNQLVFAEKRLNQEIQSDKANPIFVQTGIQTRLSPSRLESYWSCPFKFFAQSVLKLSDDEAWLEDPGFKERGQWLHGVLEQVAASDLDSWNETKINQALDDVAGHRASVLANLWPLIRQRLLGQIIRFIEFEKKWRASHSQIRPEKFELRLEGSVGAKNSKVLWSQSKTEDGLYPFAGVIDRVEVLEDGSIILVDYKSGDSTINNISTWKDNGTFQLWLYSQAIEKGLSEVLGPRSVLAAIYFSLKAMERKSGFAVESPLLASFHEDLDKKAWIGKDVRAEMDSEIEAEVASVIEGISRGEFTPNPKDSGICDSCDWRTTCRAHHLF